MKKTTLAAQASSGFVALALLTALVQADSIRHGDISDVELDMVEAAIAATEFMAGNIIEAELEMEDGNVIWEIDIVNNNNQVITVEVDGQTGQILSTDIDDDNKLQHVDAIRLAKAIDIVKAVEEGALVEAELDSDHGSLIWEVETLGNNNQESKFRINAETGEILI